MSKEQQDALAATFNIYQVVKKFKQMCLLYCFVDVRKDGANMWNEATISYS